MPLTAILWVDIYTVSQTGWDSDTLDLVRVGGAANVFLRALYELAPIDCGLRWVLVDTEGIDHFFVGAGILLLYLPLNSDMTSEPVEQSCTAYRLGHYDLLCYRFLSADTHPFPVWR